MKVLTFSMKEDKQYDEEGRDKEAREPRGRTFALAI